MGGTDLVQVGGEGSLDDDLDVVAAARSEAPRSKVYGVQIRTPAGVPFTVTSAVPRTRPRSSTARSGPAGRSRTRR
ncbi:hypothetical protein [Actinomadura madurae]|uniref:hypothetical protein n=1 Tax=Actinomadura madurae TaxID=1993 RepID=UPI0020D20C92|nr:hypothetical protein [Actinomadura madurae]MCQ0015247.1 hypothetical protein [Actinomadura madurae]